MPDREQEWADTVARQLKASFAHRPERVMLAGETGGPCRYCDEYVNPGERYVKGKDGFEDHAACAEAAS